MFLATYDTSNDRQEPELDGKPRSIIIGARDGEEPEIIRQIDELTTVVKSTPEAREGLAFARANPLDFALVFLDHDPEEAMSVAEELAQGLHTTAIMVSRDRNPELIVQAMRAGARDFAYLGQNGDVHRAVSALRLVPRSQAKTPGQVIAVFGAKGGSGVTTIAANLSGALHSVDGDKSRTILVDLDLQMGDVMVFLDSAGDFGWRELVSETDRLDDELLDKLLVRHESGIRVVAQTAPVEESEPLATAAIARSLAKLRDHAGHVIIDGLRDFNDTTLAALDLADVVVLTFTQDIPALKNASRCLGIFRRLGYGDDKVKLVVNRYQKRGKLTVDAMSDALRAPIVATIANDFPTVVGAINAGRLLVDTAPRARVTRDIRALAAILDPNAPWPKRSFWKGVWS